MSHIIREAKVIYKGTKYLQTFKIKKSIGLGKDKYKVFAYIEHGKGIFEGAQWELIDTGDDKSEADSILRSYMEIHHSCADRVKVRTNDDFAPVYHNVNYKYNLEN